MVCGDNAGERAAKRKTDEDDLSRIGGVHDREHVINIIIRGVGGNIGRARLAVAAALESDATEMLARIRQLCL